MVRLKIQRASCLYRAARTLLKGGETSCDTLTQGED